MCYILWSKICNDNVNSLEKKTVTHHRHALTDKLSSGIIVGFVCGSLIIVGMLMHLHLSIVVANRQLAHKVMLLKQQFVIEFHNFHHLIVIYFSGTQ